MLSRETFSPLSRLTTFFFVGPHTLPYVSFHTLQRQLIPIAYSAEQTFPPLLCSATSAICVVEQETVSINKTHGHPDTFHLNFILYKPTNVPYDLSSHVTQQFIQTNRGHFIHTRIAPYSAQTRIGQGLTNKNPDDKQSSSIYLCLATSDCVSHKLSRSI